jgi:hypothetical protein
MTTPPPASNLRRPWSALPAEMRAEVERMRRHLVTAPSLPLQPKPPR